MLWFCKNVDCVGNFSFDYFSVFYKIKFIVNIQSEIFDFSFSYGYQWLTIFNRILKHHFFFLAKITIALVLFACIVNLFASIHCRDFSISWLIKVSSKSGLCAFTFKHVSSAYKTGVDFKWLKMSLTYIEKSIGPRFEPWALQFLRFSLMSKNHLQKHSLLLTFSQIGSK